MCKSFLYCWILSRLFILRQLQPEKSIYSEAFAALDVSQTIDAFLFDVSPSSNIKQSTSKTSLGDDRARKVFVSFFRGTEVLNVFKETSTMRPPRRYLEAKRG